MTDFQIYGTRCFIDGRFCEATIHISEGRIATVFEGYKPHDGIALFNCEHHIVMPGVIDAHVHINEPGLTHWEGFDTATKAAALGGVTTVIEMPLNSDPVTVDIPSFEQKTEAAKGKVHVNCGFYGGVVPTNIQDVEALLNAGVFGIKGFLTHSGIDDFPDVGKAELEAIAPVLKASGLPLLLHCEIGDTDVPPVTDPRSYQAYLESRPQRWETRAIALALEIQQRFDIRVHIVHLSAADGISPIRERKMRTDRLTVETCPHYLFFNAESIPDGQTVYKCAPPIRDSYNNDRLWEFLQDGGFDFIASDHSPAPPDMKQLDTGNIIKAWGGISGLQFLLPAVVSKTLERGLSLEKLIPLLTYNPAKFLGLNHRKGMLKAGYDADIVVWDDTVGFVPSTDTIAHRHKATPYLNESLIGRVIHTFVNGNHVVDNSKLKDLNQGEVLLRTNL